MGDDNATVDDGATLFQDFKDDGGRTDVPTEAPSEVATVANAKDLNLLFFFSLLAELALHFSATEAMNSYPTFCAKCC